jgi:hypothetical protein
MAPEDEESDSRSSRSSMEGDELEKHVPEYQRGTGRGRYSVLAVEPSRCRRNSTPISPSFASSGEYDVGIVAKPRDWTQNCR